jgi:hypothetical protein
MCGLCGNFGSADHWSIVPLDGATPAADRMRHAGAANRLLAYYGLRLDVWGGRYTLRSRTGRTAVITNIGELWVAADRLSGRPCDPLDPGLLAHLAGEAA